MTRLGDVLLDVKPGFATGDNLEEGVFQFRMHNLTRESALDLTKRRRVNATAKQLENQSVAPGDVLFNATNSPELVGKSALIRELDEPAVFSNHFIRLRTDQDRLDPGYLAYFLRFEFVRGVFRSMAKAWVNQATIGRDRLESLEIPLPPLPEQRRIAAILDHADALRAKRRRVLSHLDLLAQATFDKMFGEDLPTVQLGELAETRLGKMLDAKKQTGEYRRPYLRNANVQWFHFELDDLREMDFNEKDRATLTLLPGDVLVCEGGQPGRSAIWRGEVAECYFQKALHRVRLGDDLEPEYFVRAMRKIVDSNGLKDFVTSSTIAHLTGEKLRTLPIPLPDLTSQREFGTRVAGIYKQKEAMLHAAAASNELFASLQSRAFLGDL